jgi:hypothetical protein
MRGGMGYTPSDSWGCLVYLWGTIGLFALVYYVIL